MKPTDNPSWITIQYICVLFLTICLVGLIVSDFLFIWIIAILFCMFIPALIIACISFFNSLSCKSTHDKILLVLNIVNILLFSFLFFNPTDKCNADIMENHYIKFGDRMEQIYRYLYPKLTPGSAVEIEFEHGKVSMFHFSKEGDKFESNWDPNDKKIDSLLNQCGLDRKALSWLENELEKAGCISISMRSIPEDPFCIGFRRIGLGKYSFLIYHRPLSDEEQKEINESPASIVYTPLVVFQYGGGAFGSQNFIGKDEYLKKKTQLPCETDL